MKRQSKLFCACIFAGGAAVLAACGGGGGGGGTSPAPAPAPSSTGYTDTALVSNGVVASTYKDTKLQNPWGLAFAPGGDFWVADNNDNLSTLYDGNGVANSLVVTIPNGTNGPANPSGQIYNGTTDFEIVSGAGATPALFIYDGEGGTITGWASGSAAVILYDDGAVNGSNAAVYKGLALANFNGANYLYATDLHNAKIDVFDTNFNKVSAAGGLYAGLFTDPGIPSGYAPFGIALVNGQFYVTYAQQNVGATDENLGAGLGYVDIYDLAGNLVSRFASAGVLNAPWGIALAPSGFGSAAGDLLIGNFGDGKINRFNATTGANLGTLNTPAGQPIAISGLWALVFGNGAANAPANSLYYTAGPDSQQAGIFGRIQYSSGGSGSGGGMGY